ncbi:MAG: polysaccharide deacetylase family protein [Alphaproteobacteria bacterium]
MTEQGKARAALDMELSAWAAAGRTATLWWRDDDAAAGSSALSQLLELAGRYSVPLTLGVVPRLADASLLQVIGRAANVTPVVHGYAHINHAPPAEKQAEFGAHRDCAAMCAELGEGLSILREMFGATLCPVLVPPWNRLDDALGVHLPRLGYKGVSAFRPAPRRTPAPGLVQTNCHIDSIDWRALRGQRPACDVLEELTTLLRIRRLYPNVSAGTLALGKPLPPGFDPEEPTGILTHHLVQDAQAWEFLSQLLRAIAPHCQPGGGARWLSCEEAFRLDVAAPV